MKKYLVGGAVRNKLLNIAIKEKDWVVVGSTPEEMINQGYTQVGKDFPVFLHPKTKEEYALARTERKKNVGHNGFITYTSPFISLEEDLFRRDLTINAIAIDEENNIIDPFNGQQDLNNRCLRHVSSAFSEDPLRILRLARFSACFEHLNFKIAPETLQLITQMTQELPFLTPERIWKETYIALNSMNPHIYFKVLRICGALKILFPEIDSLFNITFSSKYIHNINAGLHTLQTMSNISKKTNNLEIKFATLCLHLGKNYINQKTKLSSDDYINQRLLILKKFCKRLKIPNKYKLLSSIVIKHNENISNALYISPNQIINLFNNIKIWKSNVLFKELIYIVINFHMSFKKYYKIQYHIPTLSNQINFIIKAYILTKSITYENIISFGFKGIYIQKEITERRLNILIDWLKRSRLYYTYHNNKK